MTTLFTPPEYEETSFNCPHCFVYAHQEWEDVFSRASFGYSEIDIFKISICGHCEGISLWREGKLISPLNNSIEPPNIDLPDELKEDYLEAASIVNLSPRGAAALLRLLIQKLLNHLGEKNKSINDAIKSLVSMGLNKSIQEALDVVRVIGNDAVHPGQIDLRDDMGTASRLFKVINFICEKMITEPKQVAELFDKLPEDKKGAIFKRDN